MIYKRGTSVVMAVIKQANKIISLVGMMGSGKTTIGKLLEEKLGCPCFDSDVEIEKATGITILEIFAEYGERYFRQKEYKIIKDIIDSPLYHSVKTPRNDTALNVRTIISTGGGAYIWPITNSLLKQHTITIWLDATPEIMFNRIKDGNSRPMVEKAADPSEIFKSIYHSRLPVYSDCDLRIDTNSSDLDSIVTYISLLL